MPQHVALVDICKALVNNELVYYYQPIISLISGKICGAEALIRWEKEDGSVLLPADFIPLAEEKGLINDITLEMLPKITREIRTLVLKGAVENDFFVSFNLSEKDLTTDSLVSHIENELAKGGIPTTRLCAEISERVFMPLNDRVLKTIHQIADQGVKISLDDFSTGYSTLENLNKLPLTSLKLSMNILRLAPTSRNDFRLLRHLVSLAHQLDLDIIAEGVESKEELYLLTSTGCTAAQGFYFSHPLPFNEFINLLNDRPSWSEYPFGLEYLAQIDHIDFRRDIIREALIIYHNPDSSARQRAFNRLPAMEHNSCLMNKWFNNINNWQWHQDQKEDLDELVVLHREFHENAKRLLDAASTNKSQSQIDQMISDLTENSIRLMENLQKISTIGIQHYYQ